MKGHTFESLDTANQSEVNDACVCVFLRSCVYVCVCVCVCVARDFPRVRHQPATEGSFPTHTHSEGVCVHVMRSPAGERCFSPTGVCVCVCVHVCVCVCFC